MNFPRNLNSEACRCHENRLLYRNMQRFRGGLVFKAHRLLYHPTLGVRVIKRKKRINRQSCPASGHDFQVKQPNHLVHWQGHVMASTVRLKPSHPYLSGQSPETLSRCSLLARKRTLNEAVCYFPETVTLLVRSRANIAHIR